MCTSLSPIVFATLICVHLNGDIIVATEDWIFCHQPLPPHAAFSEAYALCLTMQSALSHPLRKGVRISPLTSMAAGGGGQGPKATFTREFTELIHTIGAFCSFLAV
jgi:hypothetical protein